MASTRAQLDPASLEWPWWVPWMTVVGATAAGGEALRHRVLEWGAGSLSLALPMVCIALVPLVLDAVAGHVRTGKSAVSNRLFLPRFLWAALMIIPVLVLLVDSPTETDFSPFLLVLMCIQAGAVARFHEGLTIALVACGGLVGLEVAGEFDSTAIWTFGNLGAWCGGLAVQKSLVLVEQEREAHADQLAGAATEERQRIAREVHDVVAHSLSVTMLHLTGARHALESGGEPAEAAAALRHAERLGRQAMHDIRRTVGLLAPDAAGDTAPMPGAADIPALVDEFIGAGLDVRCEVRGDAASVPTATGLGLYRIAQESLANVAKHAPGAEARVDLALDSSRVSLVVRSAVPGSVPGEPGANGGLGLKGMEERARLLGGTFRAGPEDGAWVVAVEVPRIESEPSPPTGGRKCA